LSELKKLALVILLIVSVSAYGQLRFSFASDISFMRNFSPQQKFWALGGTIQSNLHFNSKQSAYAWISFYTPGSFKNNFTATAKSSATFPSSLPFKASAKWRNNEVSLGWKHFFKGSFDAENGWNAYGLAGFGLLFANVENNFSPSVDTSLYLTPTRSGNSKFYRLTFDLGAGLEYPMGAGFFLYSDVRTWLPASDYPSPYLHSNKNVPLSFMISAGMRILFDY
jgi:hypothetical protein